MNRLLYKKIRDSWINSILFGCFLLSIFLVLFYLSNLNLKPAPRLYSPEQKNLDNKRNEDLKKLVGETNNSTLNYGEWIRRNNLDELSDPDGDGLPNYLEYIYGTDPINPDTDADGYSDKQEILNGYDPDAKGDIRPTVEISISKIKVEAPMVWSKSQDEKKLLDDLKRGVSHYPKTASPGQPGNMIISGHSSNYVWAPGEYNYIFKDLNNLEKGDVIDVKTIQENSKVILYHYRVTDKFTAAPDDERIFSETPIQTITLTTCWPLGTALKRLIVKGELVK